MGNVVAINRNTENSWNTLAPEALARHVLRRHHLEETMPVPIIEVCSAEGIREVRQATFRDPTVSGMIRSVSDGHVIYVRASDPAVRQRFTMAHELGHYLLQIRGVRDSAEINVIERGNVEALYRRAGQVDENERTANVFAAALLMPTPVLRKLRDAYKPRMLAEFLAVSEEALRIRLRSFV